MSEKINDDVFDYGGGFTQCISNFRRSAIDAIGDDLGDHMHNGKELAEARERMEYRINELVRWCRHLNRQAQEAKAYVEKLERTLGCAVDAARWMQNDRTLGLKLGDDLFTDGIPALKRQRDDFKSALMRAREMLYHLAPAPRHVCSPPATDCDGDCMTAGHCAELLSDIGLLLNTNGGHRG